MFKNRNIYSAIWAIHPTSFKKLADVGRFGSKHLGVLFHLGDENGQTSDLWKSPRLNSEIRMPEFFKFSSLSCDPLPWVPEARVLQGRDEGASGHASFEFHFGAFKRNDVAITGFLQVFCVNYGAKLSV